MSWGKCIDKVTKNLVTGRYVACELLWKTFRMAGEAVRMEVLRDGEEAEVEKFKVEEFKS